MTLGPGLFAYAVQQEELRKKTADLRNRIEALSKSPDKTTSDLASAILVIDKSLAAQAEQLRAIIQELSPGR